MITLSHQDYVAVPVPLALYHQLLAKEGEAANAVIEDQIQGYLERTADDVVAPRLTEGVSWDNVFLPAGTRLRTKYYGEYKYAEVVGDQIVFNDERYSSVSRATNQMRGATQNNAWKVLEVLRPTDPQWFAAEFLRRRG